MRKYLQMQQREKANLFYKDLLKNWAKKKKENGQKLPTNSHTKKVLMPVTMFNSPHNKRNTD